MASGGRVIYKRAAPGGRRLHRSKTSDDDDEEYVLEEEEDEEESSDEALDSSDASEGEFEFGGSTSGSDDVNRPAAERDEDDEISLGRRPKRLKCSSRAKKRAVKKPRVSYYDNDDDYKAEEEEEEEEEEELDAEEEEEIPSLRRRRRKNRNSRAVRSRYQKTKESDYEDVEMEREEDGKKEILSLRKRERNGNASAVRSHLRMSKGSEYKEEEIEEEEEADEKEVLSLRKRGRNRNSPAARPHHQQAKGSDYEEEEMEEEDEKDEDFSPDEQDLVDEDASMPSGLKKQGQMRKGGKMQEQRISRQKKRGNRWRKRSEYDDDFIVKDRVAARRKAKKARRNRSSTSKDTKKQSSEESDMPDFDFVSSDDDFVEETIVLDEPRNKSRSIQKTKSSVIRRQKVSPEELESCSDGDYNISEHVLRDLGSNGIVDLLQTDRIVARIKGVEKGKEKENEESGKPLCGICLTEEHRTTVRGVLNSCTHFFCFPCIMEWSKVESRCPVCKRRFGTITKSSRSDPGFGLRKTVIKVEKRDQVYQPSEEEIRRMLDPYENVVCIECHQGGDDSLMLLCDICDSPAHTYCVGLGREVPEGNWYCQCCKSAGDDSSYLQNQDFGVDQTAGNSDMLGSLNDTEVSTPCGNTNLHRSSQPSFHEFDLNVSPRSVENSSSISQPHGVGPSTVLGRRAIQQRICIMLSHDRSRQSFQET
ncbi:uncharacterized protein LOC141815659 [Curcuma longa]|uniref:uncharacterized protein LOC141815659 n=1 Tax=Curcuma longa TaxID=136217 RepID=UPI003D9F60B4